MKFSGIEKNIVKRNRLRAKEIEFLLTHPECLLDLAAHALRAKKERHGDRIFYGNNLNINPTNICEARCPLCAFSRDENEPDAYIKTIDSILARVRKFLPLGLLEVHIVGGLYDRLKLDYYEKLLSGIKKLSPSLYVQAFTAVEIDYFSRINNLTARQVLARLKDKGLDSMPGGGAEIFSPRVRKIIAPEKIAAGRYFEIMKTAHSLGIKSNVTMLYGHVETAGEIADHLLRIRDFQDKSHGVMTFVPLAFHEENTKIKTGNNSVSGVLDLTILSVARIALDNVPHIKALWTYLGKKMTQTALSFGADDIGATAADERIASAAGAKSAAADERIASADDLEELIKDCGMKPVLVDSGYNPRKKFK